MPNEGSLVLIIILIVLQGVTGISFGLVISSAIDDEQSANQAALGIFYPNLIISGRPGLDLRDAVSLNSLTKQKEKERYITEVV